MIGLTILVLHVTVAILAPWIVPYSPTALDPDYLFAPPSWVHPFGTDQYGRDILTRVLLGGRLALVVAVSAAFLSVLVGGLLGIWLGYVGGWQDEVAMRLVDASLVLPDLLLILTIITVFGAGWSVILLVLVIIYVPGLIRIVRAATLDMAPREFILAARARGEPTLSIIWRELLPNVQDVLLVEFAMRVSWSVVAVSGLAFLGFGVPPTTPDWGLMIAENRQALAYAPWCTLFPVLAISSLVIGFNLATEGLAKALGIDRTGGTPV
jgi:peptide/nickel transport system permease protein